MRAALALILAAALSACATAPARVCPTTPVPVEIERRVYVPVPAAYTDPLPIATPTARTVRELRRVARERKATLELANEHRAETARLAPPEGR
jgi:hypothetical protein